MGWYGGTFRASDDISHNCELVLPAFIVHSAFGIVFGDQ